MGVAQELEDFPTLPATELRATQIAPANDTLVTGDALVDALDVVEALLEVRFEPPLLLGVLLGLDLGPDLIGLLIDAVEVVLGSGSLGRVHLIRHSGELKVRESLCRLRVLLQEGSDLLQFLS